MQPSILKACRNSCRRGLKQSANGHDRELLAMHTGHPFGGINDFEPFFEELIRCAMGLKNPERQSRVIVNAVNQDIEIVDMEVAPAMRCRSQIFQCCCNE